LGKRGVPRGLVWRRSREQEPALGGASSVSAPKPKLLNQVRQAIRARHDSLRTEQVYVAWIKRFIFFHGVRHPAEMGEQEIRQFSSDLNDDLHSCSEPGRPWRSQPARLTMNAWRSAQHVGDRPVGRVWRHRRKACENLLRVETISDRHVLKPNPC
jgi:cyclopropane fatty-acyl-phospholipid synthase-like methyltransferase